MPWLVSCTEWGWPRDAEVLWTAALCGCGGAGSASRPFAITFRAARARCSSRCRRTGTTATRCRTPASRTAIARRSPACVRRGRVAHVCHLCCMFCGMSRRVEGHPTPSHSPLFFLSLSLTLPPSHTHTLSSLALALSLTPSLCLSHTHALAHPVTLSHTGTHAHTRGHARACIDAVVDRAGAAATASSW